MPGSHEHGDGDNTILNLRGSCARKDGQQFWLGPTPQFHPGSSRGENSNHHQSQSVALGHRDGRTVASIPVLEPNYPNIPLSLAVEVIHLSAARLPLLKCWHGNDVQTKLP